MQIPCGILSSLAFHAIPRRKGALIVTADVVRLLTAAIKDVSRLYRAFAFPGTTENLPANAFWEYGY
jgi:hypothetical protein